MLKFIDLFAGIGGFHEAMVKLSHECVFACEINESLAVLYEKNFNIKPARDIRKVNITEIPKFDILCAGFPCQPFSKAGKQEGMNDSKRGNLFDEIVKILEYHQPSYFILENVPFIAKHDNEQTWNYMKNKLENELKYHIDHDFVSPLQLGIPQHRQRMFIIGSKNKIKNFNWEMPKLFNKIDVHEIIDKHPIDSVLIGQDEYKCLDLWQEFIDCIPKNIKIPSFPIWAMEFGATYPYENHQTPYCLKKSELNKYKGSFGKKIAGLTKKEQLDSLPSYARTEQSIFPNWKKNYIKYNREFYESNKYHLKKIVDKISEYKSQSWQKLEWNVADGERNIRNYIIQFRASGIRVKKTDFFPSLVCTSTQIPIIGWENRYITRNEGKKLQSFNGIELPANNNACFKALGNAVNVDIVYNIAKKLIPIEKENLILMK